MRASKLLGERALEPRLLGLVQRLRADLEAPVGIPADCLAAPLDDGALLTDDGRLLADVRDGDGLRRRELDLCAALELDAEVEPLDHQRDHAQADGDQREDEPEPPPADDVNPLPARDLLGGGPHEARVVEPLEARRAP